MLAVGHDDLRRALEQLLQLRGAVTLLGGIRSLTDGDAPILQEGVGALAAGSALAVVVPVDARAHSAVL